jgi:hypothetical protein
MGKKKSKDVFTEFLNGKAFAKVVSKEGFYDFVRDIQKKSPNVMVDIPTNMLNDFGVNKLSQEYHLVYFPKTNQIHCAEKEFFDYVYKTEWITEPNADSKIFWFEV